MSKIKDLLAEQENIDDLKPTKETLRLAVFETIKEDIESVKESMLRDAEWGYGTDDEGHKEMYFENFTQQCDHYASSYLDAYMSDNAIDISDDVYDSTQEWLAANLADYLADFEADAIAEHDE